MKYPVRIEVSLMRFRSRYPFAAAIAGTLLLLSSCQSPNRKAASESDGIAVQRRLNLVLVTIDTLRPDRLGCYGYSKIETPNLDALAKSGALFETAVTHTPLTAPSHASMFTGLYPTVHKVRDTGGFVLQTPHKTLTEILQRQGWDTAAFVGSSVLKKHFGFDRGFAVYDDEMPKPDPRSVAGESPERRAGEVVDRATAWLASQSGHPYFLWVHVYDPHFPYDPPPPFREKYRDRPYDGEVAYTDQQLGRLFAAVAKKSPENTLIAVVSDHGESLAEHGEYTHGIFLYDSTLRVAFLMAGPGIPKGLRVKQQARVVDLLPTVLELMGGKAPRDVQGASLAPAFSGRQLRPAYSYEETLYPKINHGWAELRGLRTDRWKYIRAPKSELYDLAQDPAETTNVIGSHPEELPKLEASLKAAIAAGGSEAAEKVQTTQVDQRTMEQLKSLGYLGGSSGREYSLTGEGVDPKDRVAVLKTLFLSISPGTTLPQRIAMLRRAFEQDPADPGLYYHLGDAYSKAGRYNEALKLYQDGIRAGLENSWLSARIGHLYIQQGNKINAIPALEKAVHLNPSDTDSLNDLAMAYLETQRIEDSERTFKWLLAADEHYALAHNGLGLIAIQKRDISAARGHFEKAVQLDPNLLEAQLNLGRIYKNMGANARARACWEAFLAKASPAEYGRIIPKIKAELAAMQ
jgi:choline-sulfatase